MKEVSILECKVFSPSSIVGFWHFQAHKKGLLSDDNGRQCVAFAKRMGQEHGDDFWKEKSRVLFGWCQLCFQNKPFGSGKDTFWKNTVNTQISKLNARIS